MGAVLLAAFLERNGISRSLQAHYRRSGWLTAVGRGAFVRGREVPSWRAGLHALQVQAELAVHLGGDAALAARGRAHFLRPGGGGVRLFAPRGTTLPAWFRSGPWGVPIGLVRSNFLPCGLGVESHATAGEVEVRTSTPERAILECLYLTPGRLGLIEAHHLMEGLIDLRPAAVRDLLLACRSVRVKRLFLYTAAKAGHPWLPFVSLDGVDLGAGKRRIGGGGAWVAEHGLSVPPELAEL